MLRQEDQDDGGEDSTHNGVDDGSTKKKRFGARTVSVCCFTTLGGLVFGFDTGVIGGVMVMDDFRTTMGLPLIAETDSGETGDSTETAKVLGTVVAMLSVGAFIGAPIAGPLADWQGRKKATILGAFLATIGGVCQSVAEGLGTIYIGRLIVGIGVGFLSAVVPLYNAEVAPQHARGLLVSLQQLAITFGILLAFVSNLGFADHGYWRGSLWCQTAASTLLLLGGPLLPESPRWLVAHGRVSDARQVLRRLRVHSTPDEVTAELEGIEAAVNEAAEAAEARGPRQKGDSICPAFLQGASRYRTMLGVMVMVFSQMTGINAVIYYSPTIFASVGVAPLKATAVVGVLNFLSTFVAMALIDKFGRKKLFFLGGVGMLISLILASALLLAAPTVLQNSTNSTNSSLGSWADGSGVPNAPEQVDVLDLTPSAGMCIAAMVIFYAFCFAFSWGPVGWVFVSEIFALEGRGAAVGLATCMLWLVNTVLAYVTPVMLAGGFGTAGTFFFYSGFVLVGGIFVECLCPETKGIGLEEIDLIFAPGNGWRSIGNANTGRSGGSSCCTALCNSGGAGGGAGTENENKYANLQPLQCPDPDDGASEA